LENQLTWGRFHGLVKIGIHRFPDVDPQLLHGIGLGMNPNAKGGSSEAAFHLVFSNLKNYLAHAADVYFASATKYLRSRSHCAGDRKWV